MGASSLKMFQLLLATSFLSMMATQKAFLRLDQMGQGYMAYTETTYRNGNQTVATSLFTREYHDLHGKRGKIEDDSSSTFYYPNMKQAVVTSVGAKKSCAIYSLEFLEGLLEDMWESGTFGFYDKENQILGPTAFLFNQLKMDPEELKDDHPIRGIKCTKYMAVTLKDDFIVHYFVPMEGWSGLGGGDVRLPLRVTVTGNIDSVQINETYDFLKFDLNVPSQIEFNIPTGIGCPGLLVPTNATFPSVEEQYSFFAELYNITSGQEQLETFINTTRVLYDNMNGLVKLEAWKSHQWYIEVQDYNTGVSYFMDPSKEDCMMGAIYKAGSETNDRGLVGAMKDPRQFLNMDGNKAYYLGKKFNRGIFCDVWEAVKYNVSVGNVYSPFVVYTYYFMSDDYSAISEGDNNVKIPVSLGITAYNKDSVDDREVMMEMVYNIFDFDEADGRLLFQEIDVEMCFKNDRDREYFIITFPNDNSTYQLSKNQKPLFKSIALQNIAAAASVSPIRIPYLEFNYKEGEISYLAMMINRPPALTGFYLQRENVIPTMIMRKVKTGDADGCASQCLLYSLFKCKAFATCGTECYVTDDVNAYKDGEQAGGKATCNYYIKSVLESNLIDEYLQDAKENLEADIYNGRLVVEHETVDGKPVTLTATKVEFGVNPLKNGREGVSFETILTQYQLSVKGNDQVVMELLNVQIDSAHECYSKCVQEPSMDCSGFSYCDNNKVCRLTMKYIEDVEDEHPDELRFEPATGCNVYRKSSLGFFKKVPGQVMARNGDKKTFNIKSPDQCAQECRSDKSMTCRSFDYCRSGLCIWYKTHAGDGEQMTNHSGICEHYSLDYGAEYQPMGKMLVVDPRAVTKTDISFEDCARLCSEELSGFGCKSINYCPEEGFETGTSECQLSRYTIQDTVDFKESINRTCLHYYRMGTKDIGPIDPDNPYRDDTIFPDISKVYKDTLESHTEITFDEREDIIIEDGKQKTKIITTTIFYNEFHNFKDRLGRITITNEGLGYDLDAFYRLQDTNNYGKILEIDNNNPNSGCNYRKIKTYLDKRPNVDQWGWDSNLKALLGPAAIFWRPTKEPPVFKGNDTIRGINCAVFEATDLNGVNIHYYFSESRWTAASTDNHTVVPVRVILKGPISLNGTSTNTMQYDFTQFRPVKPAESLEAFKFLKDGVGCRDFFSPDFYKMELPSVYKATAERYDLNSFEDQLSTTVYLQKALYNQDERYIKLEYKDAKNTLMTEIEDYRTGVTYRTLSNGTCIIEPIQTSAGMESNGVMGVVKWMKNPSAFMGLEGTDFYYIGKEVYRSILCNVYENVQNDVKSSDSQYKKIVTTVYRAAKLNTKKPGLKEEETVVAILKSIYQASKSVPIKLMFNIFAYNENPPRLWEELNVAQCFPKKTERRHFLIRLTPSRNDFKLMVEDRMKFEGATIRRIQTSARFLSVLRINDYQFHYGNENSVSVVGLMLEHPPILKRFREHPTADAFFRKTNVLKLSMEQCAQRSIDITASKGFTICRNSPTAEVCYLTFEDMSVKITPRTDNNKNCTLYFKSVTHAMKEQSLTEGLKSLKRLENYLNIWITGGNGAMVYTADYININVEPKEEDDNLYETAFTLKRLSNDSETTKLIGGPVSSESDCYRRCLNENNMLCSSFSYCQADSSCRISSVYLDTDAPSSLEEVEETTSCNVYNKMAIQFFEATPGIFPSVKGKTTYGDVRQEGDCASKCHGTKDYNCQGFQICPDTQECILYDSHYLDINAINQGQSGTCEHFALKHSSLLTLVGNFTLDNRGGTSSFEGMGFEQCAKRCLGKEFASEFCRSIDFCPDVRGNTGTCIIHDVTFDEVPMNYTVPRCRHYMINDNANPTEFDPIYTNILKTFNKAFETEVEITTKQSGKSQSTSSYFEHYHDPTNKRGLIATVDQNSRKSQFYFIKEKQVAITGKDCVVVPYTNYTRDSNPDQRWAWNSDLQNIYGPAAILWKKTTRHPKFQKTSEEIRNMAVSKFTAQIADQNINVTYYFTARMWTSNNKDLVPVRVLITNVPLPSGKVDLQYDFMYFKLMDKASTDTAFMVTKGLGCEGLQISGGKSIGKLQPQFSMVKEKYGRTARESTLETYIDLEEAIYDGNSNMVKIKYHPNLYSSVTEIHDFNTGVSYSTDNVKDNCDIVPITSPKSMESEGIVDGIIRGMKSPEKFLDIDGDFYYLGQEYHRNILCDVFERVKRKVVTPELTYDKIVTTLFITTDEFESVSNGDVNFKIPMQLIHNAYLTKDTKEPIETRYNLFRFDSVDGKDFRKEFNVESCFKETRMKTLFKIYFDVNDKTISSSRKLRFESGVFEKMKEATGGVSPIRINLLKPIYEPKPNRPAYLIATLYGSLLEGPPAIARFSAYPGKAEPAFRVDGKDKHILSVSREECASMCVSEKTINCTTFTVCGTSDQKMDCYLSSKDMSNKPTNIPQDDPKDCTLYFRNVKTSISDPPLKEAMELLKKDVSLGRKSYLYQEFSSGKIKVTPKGIEDNVLPFERENEWMQLVFTESQLDDGVQTTTELQGNVASVGECYRKCIVEKNIACASFSWCSSTNKCRLSSNFMIKDSKSSLEEVKEATSCNVYNKAALQYFEESPGMFPAFSGRAVRTQISTDEECASFCHARKEFQCKGFQRCPDTQQCILYDTHILDSKQTIMDQNTLCKHFYYKYSAEFADMGNIMLKNPKRTVLASVSFEECAKTCRLGNYGTCRSIDYCSQKTDSDDSSCYVHAMTMAEVDFDTTDGVCKNYMVIVPDTNSTAFPPTNETTTFPDLEQVLGYKYSIHSTTTTKYGDSEPYSVYEEEYHDLVKQRGLVEQLKNGFKESTYYFVDVAQMAFIMGNSCTVHTYDFLKIESRIGWGKLSPDQTIYGPSAILQLAKGKSSVFIRSEGVRTIPCNKFTLASVETDPKVSIDYYFSTPEWSKLNGYKQPIPVRARVTGLTGKLLQRLDVTVDFTFFKNEDMLKDLDQFFIPGGIGCPGLNTGEYQDRPQIKSKISFNGEIYQKGDPTEQRLQSTINLDNSWFDGPNKILKKITSDEKQQRVTFIQDYNSGVNYAFSRDGKCTIGPLDKPVASDAGNGVVGRMKDSSQVMGFDGEFYYLGNKMYRGIYCDVWETVKTNVLIQNTKFLRLVETVYYMSPDFESVTTKGNSVLQVPIRGDYQLINTNKEIITGGYNLFNFDQSDDGTYYDDMDITTCFENANEMEYFLLHFPSNHEMNQMAQQTKAVFRSTVQSMIAELAQISGLRVKIDSISYTDEEITVLGVLLDRPRYQDGFYLFNGKDEPRTGDTLRKDINNIENCAQACIQQDKTPCKSIILCKKTEVDKECYLSTHDELDRVKTPIPGTQNCQYYIRADANITTEDQPLSQAHVFLYEAVDAGKFRFELGQGPETFLYTANQMEERTKPFNFHELKQAESIMDDKELKSIDLEVVDVPSGQANSLEGCYQKCLDEEGISCASFSYCTTSKRCRLSSVYIDPYDKKVVKERIVDGTSCTVYLKSAIDFYKPYPGLTPLTTTTEAENNARSPEECALRCRGKKGECRAFIFCQSTSKCHLQKEHMLDLSNTTSQTSVCNYYAEKYSLEFSQLPNMVLHDPESSTYVDVSLEQCSKMCKEQPELGCRSINYCPVGKATTSNLCIINSIHQLDRPNEFKLEKSPTCSYYFMPELQTPLPGSIFDPNSKSLISSGSFAGTAIALIIVGIFLGIAGYFVAAWYKKTHMKPDGVTVRYVSQP